MAQFTGISIKKLHYTNCDRISMTFSVCSILLSETRKKLSHVHSCYLC